VHDTFLDIRDRWQLDDLLAGLDLLDAREAGEARARLEAENN
jgi:hypothetical protein